MRKRQVRLPFPDPSPPEPPLPAGPVPKLQMLEAIVSSSPSILTEDARDTFLTLI